MRKFMVCALMLVFIAFVPKAFSESSGNCLEPLGKTTEVLGVAGSFEYNYVANRYNKLDNNSSRFKDLEIENTNEVYGKFSVALFDNFNVYANIGGALYDVKYTDRVDNVDMIIKLEPGLYTGTGINCLFPVFGNLSVGGNIYGGFLLNNVKDISRRGRDCTSASGQLYTLNGVNSLYASYRFDIEYIKTAIIPYVGGYHAWIITGTSEKLDYIDAAPNVDVKKHIQAAYDILGFGLLVGLDVEVTKYAVFNLEGRFIGENAFTCGASIKF